MFLSMLVGFLTYIYFFRNMFNMKFVLLALSRSKIGERHSNNFIEFPRSCARSTNCSLIRQLNRMTARQSYTLVLNMKIIFMRFLLSSFNLTEGNLENILFNLNNSNKHKPILIQYFVY